MILSESTRNSSEEHSYTSFSLPRLCFRVLSTCKGFAETPVQDGSNGGHPSGKSRGLSCGEKLQVMEINAYSVCKACRAAGKSAARSPTYPHCLLNICLKPIFDIHRARHGIGVLGANYLPKAPASGVEDLVFGIITSRPFRCAYPRSDGSSKLPCHGSLIRRSFPTN